MVILQVGFGEYAVAVFHFGYHFIGNCTAVKPVAAFIANQFQCFGKVGLNQYITFLPRGVLYKIGFSRV